MSRNFKGSLCDVGSGAGFPSIPLKIMNPELDVTIIETLGKPKKIFCKDSSTAERIILEKMRTYSQH